MYLEVFKNSTYKNEGDPLQTGYKAMYMHIVIIQFQNL